MAFSYYGSVPTSTNAYHVDASGNEYFGEAAKESDTSRPRWTIFMKFNGTIGSVLNNSSGKDWIILFPIDPATGVASAAPTFIFDNCESLTYGPLGTNGHYV